MKSPEQNVLSDVAECVSDAKVVDWVGAESSAENDQQKEVVRNFSIIANIARVHRAHQELSEEITAPAPQKIRAEALLQWGHLEILERVGDGAFAEVFRARDTRLDREVALKLYHNREKISNTASFLKEGRLLARVKHPNIVTVYGADEHDGRVGIWMELVHGQTLSQLVRRQGPFGGREAAGIGIDVCRAVAAIHKAGLLHRDIKAQNVMREEGGRILLLDLGFGSHRVVEDVAKSERRIAGTPFYMAPELFRLEPASVQSDVYAIGILLYFLTTDSFPDVKRNRVSRVETSGRTLRDARPELPDDYITVVDKAISADASQRFSSAGQMAADLGRTTGVEPAKRFGLKSVLGTAVALFIAVLVALWPPDACRVKPEARSIAILPLQNHSEDQALDFLSSGIGHGVISRLSRLEQLKVVSGTTVERYRGGDIDLERIGQELSVQALLNGHIDVVDGQLVVYVELVDTRENRSLWGQRFVREPGDILDVEEQFAIQIAGALGLELRDGQAEQLGRRYTSVPEAYQLCKMGEFFAEKRTRPDLEKAIGYYQQAIDMDPRYPRAFAGLADTYALLGTGYFVADKTLTRDEILDRAREAAQMAVEIDERLPEAHVSLGLLYTIDSLWLEAEEHYRRAIALSPNLVIARQRYSRYLSFSGRHDEAILHAKKALELDPMSPLQIRNMGFVYYDARDFRFAITHLKKAMELEPEIPAARDILALCHWHLGEGTKTVAEYEDVSPWKARFFHLIHSGNGEAAVAVLEENVSTVPDWLQPLYYMLAGRQDTALARLEDLVAAGEPNTEMPLREKAFDHLVNDERFLRLLERQNVKWRYGVGSVGDPIQN